MTNLGFKAKEVHKIFEWNSSPFLFQIINKTFLSVQSKRRQEMKRHPWAFRIGQTGQKMIT